MKSENQKPLSPMAKQYKLCYQLYYRQASPALRAKIDEARKTDSPMQEDAEVKAFVKSVIELAEAPEVRP